MSDIESYKYVVEIYKGYLDTAITANVWFYTVTGAIGAYYLSHRKEQDKKFLRQSLLVPLFFGVLLTATSIAGIYFARQLESKVIEIAGPLGVQGAPPVDILVIFLAASVFLSLITCLGLLSLFKETPKSWYQE